MQALAQNVNRMKPSSIPRAIDALNPKDAPPALAAAAATLLAAGCATVPPSPAVIQLVAAIRTPDDAVRGPAWQNAGQFGAEAVQPLISLMADRQLETARCAHRALWKIVHATGHPDRAESARKIGKALVAALPQSSPDIARELIWMLSKIDDDPSVPARAARRVDPALRKDTRCAQTRLPSKRSLAVLRHTRPIVPEVFNFTLAESLRLRGVNAPAYPSKKTRAIKLTAEGVQTGVLSKCA